jgi:TRAP transporter TAXI family solute receptor
MYLKVVNVLLLAGSLVVSLCCQGDAKETSATLRESLPSVPELPRAMAWSAYNLGTTGYNQAVGIAKMMKDRHRMTLRIIPGKNDVSRLLPLRVNRVQFSANGVATYFAQEGVFQFASKRWGPMPVRVVLMSVGLSNQAIAVADNGPVKNIVDLRGRRVPWVFGAPALNISTEAIMACGGITWNDVTRVEFPGYVAMWNAMIDGQIDTAYATTVSGPTRRMEASPYGIRWLQMPHNHVDCWERVHAVAPYLEPHVATRGAAISDTAPHEGGTYPYPVLTTLSDQDPDLVYAVTAAIHQGYDAYKDADPGSIGWGLDRQRFKWVVPFHPGAIEYFRALGIWTQDFEDHQAGLVARQQVLADAWQGFATSEGIDDLDKTAFAAAWMTYRASYLSERGFNPVWEE